MMLMPRPCSASGAHAACTGKLGVMGICIVAIWHFRAAMNREALATTCLRRISISAGWCCKTTTPWSEPRREIRGELLMIWETGSACSL